MEFIDSSEVALLLKDHGVFAGPESGDQVRLTMTEGDDVVRIVLTCAEEPAAPAPGERVIKVDPEHLAQVADAIVQKLRLNQILLIPIGKWRKVFDAVAFSLADNAEWQEFDASATVELNTRDPLLCEAGDLLLVRELIIALLKDGELEEQSLAITCATTPLLIEVIPDHTVRVALGNHVLADEVEEVLQP